MFQRAWDPTSRPHLRQHSARAVRRAHDELKKPCRHVVPEPQSWRFRRPERIGSNLPNNVSLVNPPRIIVWAAFSTYILEICRIKSRGFTNLVLLHCFPSRFDHYGIERNMMVISQNLPLRRSPNVTFCTSHGQTTAKARKSMCLAKC